MPKIFSLSDKTPAWEYIELESVPVVENVPEWLTPMVKWVWKIIESSKDILFVILDDVPDALQLYWAASYFDRKVLWLSIPKDDNAKLLLYYTALHELYDMSNSPESMLNAEKRVLEEAQKNGVDTTKLIEYHIGFFKGSLAVQNTSEDEHAKKIQGVIDYLEGLVD